MGVHKWELRYPLLLLCITAITNTAEAAVTCNNIKIQCKAAGGAEMAVDKTFNCTSAKCWTRAPATLVDIFQSYGVHPPPKTMQPVLRAVSGTSFPASAGDTFNLTCLAWEKPSVTGFKDIRIQALSKPALPTAIKRSKITVFGTQGFSVRVVSIPVKMTGDRHKQAVYCSTTFATSSLASPTEKPNRRGTKFVLYAFKQTRPVVKGPAELDLNEEGTWECVTDEVTVDTEDQYEVAFVTAPEVPITIKRDRTATVMNPGGTPKRYKITLKMTFSVPARLMPAFFVKCYGNNIVLAKVSDGEPVVTAASLRVKVTNKPNSLDMTFNIIGTAFGLAGLVLAGMLVYLYCRKMKQEAAAGKAGTKKADQKDEKK